MLDSCRAQILQKMISRRAGPSAARAFAVLEVLRGILKTSFGGFPKRTYRLRTLMFVRGSAWKGLDLDLSYQAQSNPEPDTRNPTINSKKTLNPKP